MVFSFKKKTNWKHYLQQKGSINEERNKYICRKCTNILKMNPTNYYSTINYIIWNIWNS